MPDLQEQFARIAELLQVLRDTNPAAQEAWEAVTVRCPHHLGWDEDAQIYRDYLVSQCVTCSGHGRYIRNISDWPEGAVRGLLEWEVATPLRLDFPGLFVGVPSEGRTAALVTALIAALGRENRHATDG